MRTAELQSGDLVCLKDDTKYELPLKVDGILTNDVSLEGDPWEFDDKDCQPHPIEITKELLNANGWEFYTCRCVDDTYITYCSEAESENYLEWKNGDLYIWFDYGKDYDEVYADILVPCKYVHQLQQVLRLAGMTELANNFKVK